MESYKSVKACGS